jgi:hypothetical protein
MALDKWQQRQVAEHAKNNEITEDAAVKDLFPEEAPAPARKVAAAKPAPKAKDGDGDKTPAQA